MPRIITLTALGALIALFSGIALGQEVAANQADARAKTLRVASWNLLNLATTGQVLENSDLREELALQRRLAVNMAVVTKLNLALYQYNISLRHLQQSREVKTIDSEIAKHTRYAAISSAASKVQSVVTAAAELRTDLSLLQSYADAQSAYGAVLVALGLNPVPETYLDLDIHELTNLIAVYDKTWQDGNIPLAGQ